jgi:hypothetical protein
MRGLKGETPLKDQTCMMGLKGETPLSKI